MSTLVKTVFFIIDILFLNVSILLSFYISETDSFNSSNVSYLIIFSNISWFFLVIVSNPYNINKAWLLSKIVKSELIFIFVHLMVVASLVFFFRREYAWFQVCLIYLFFVPFFFFSKLLTYYLRKVFTPEVPFKNYIIVGRNQAYYDIRKYYRQNVDLKYKFLSSFEDFRIEEIQNFCIKNDVHVIICCINDSNNPLFRKLVEFGLDSLIKVTMISSLNDNQPELLQIERNDVKDITDIEPIHIDRSQNQFAKRIFDFIFSLIFILSIMSWLLPIIALLIKIDSKGPVFFLQLRSGKENKPFLCFKFRTMKVNVDADMVQATKSDPRITKLGAFLRKTSIDELPQFFNVFIGNMSVVGPRPHMLKHTEEYSRLIEKFLGRQYVKPGITGLAQCMGYRGETQTVTDMENRVRLDRYYIENWTFWLDIKIIFLTVISLIRGSDKAY